MIESLVEQIEARFQEAQAQMSDPEVIGDRQRYAEAGRLFNQLSTAAKLAEAWRHAKSDAEGAEEMLTEGGEDQELRTEMEAAFDALRHHRHRARHGRGTGPVDDDLGHGRDATPRRRDHAGPVGGP